MQKRELEQQIVFITKPLQRDQHSAVAKGLRVLTIFMALLCTRFNEKQACSVIISLTGEHSMKNKTCIFSDQQGNDASLPSTDKLHASDLLGHVLPLTTAGPSEQEIEAIK